MGLAPHKEPSERLFVGIAPHFALSRELAMGVTPHCCRSCEYIVVSDHGSRPIDLASCFPFFTTPTYPKNTLQNPISGIAPLPVRCERLLGLPEVLHRSQAHQAKKQDSQSQFLGWDSVRLTPVR